MIAPRLVFGWGNASRGDDALGPLFVQRLREALGPRSDVECLEDHQLQIEHALDLHGRSEVVFVDASREAQAPFELTRLVAASKRGFTTHALSPQALMQVYRELHGRDAPPCTLLAIQATSFELGAAPSAAASAHLLAALQWAAIVLKVTNPRISA